jgi:predicted ribosome quality control (RQC) complex YloA/Tae2 family protein
MDNFALEALIREITPALLQKRIQKIKRRGETGFALGLRSRTNEFLIISLEQSSPTVFLADEAASPQREASDWLLTLRKYLIGGKILNLHKEFSERKVLIEVESYRHSPLPKKLFLVLELIPAKTNALLLHENQGVIASFYPGSTYSRRGVGASEARPRSSQAIDRISEVDFHQWVQDSDSLGNGYPGASRLEQTSGAREPLAVFRSKSAQTPIRPAGMSRYFVEEISCVDCQDPGSMWERFQMMLKRVREGPYVPQLYFLRGRRETSTGPEHLEESSTRGGATQLLVSPFPLHSLRGVEHAEFPSLNAAAAKAYQIGASNAPLLASQKSQLSQVDALLRKKKRLLKNLQDDLRKVEGTETYKKYADLLYAYPGKSPPGHNGVRLIDLFDSDQREIEVPLDPRLSSIQNAVRYSKLYQKARRSIPLIAARIRKTEHEIKILADQKQSVVAATTLEGLRAAVSASRDAPLVRGKMGKSSKTGLTTGQETTSHSKVASDSLVRKTAKSFVSSDGLTILVGKSSKDNDTLTLKIAQSDDFWFHVSDYGGSHVVLKNPQKLAVPPRQSLLEAAQLAAYFSQARNASKVEVHYTQRKFVSKPRGAKAGLVRLRDYKSVSVRPELLSPHPA